MFCCHERFVRPTTVATVHYAVPDISDNTNKFWNQLPVEVTASQLLKTFCHQHEFISFGDSYISQLYTAKHFLQLQYQY